MNSKSDSATDDEIEYLNQALDKSARLNIYTAVQVLTLFWENEEEGFQGESTRVNEMFAKIFSYPVEAFAIPQLYSYLALHRYVTGKAIELVKRTQETRGSGLLIIHYGGHGDPDDRKHEGGQRRAVWSSDPDAKILLPWHKLQEDLDHLEVDLLLLFDCCFAAQAGRGTSEHLGKFELLAAAPMRSLTQSPGEKSFTSALIREITASYDERQVVVIQDLHARLMKRTQDLWATPVYVNLRPGKKSINLERLPLNFSKSSERGLASTSITIVLRTEKDVKTLNINDFVQWLGEDRPRDFSSAKVLQMTANIGAFMQQIASADSHLKKAIREPSMDNLFQTWDQVLALTEQCNSWGRQDGRDVSSIRSRAELLLDKLAALNGNFTDTLERSVISVECPEDSAILEQASTDRDAISLGILDSLKLRQVIFHIDAAGTKTQVPSLSPATLTEEKRYDGHFSPQETEELKHRIQHLADILGTPKSSRFLALTCYFCEQKAFQKRFLLHFQIPDIYDATPGRRYTLISIIENIKGAKRPSLDERLSVSHALAKAVLEWHSAGWVHQGISSPSIKFFWLKETEQIDYAHPFLLGFEFSRPDKDPSISRPTDDPYIDVYRHPTRQGLARQGHQKVHDYYSLGVVLLEIGLWQSAVQLTSVHGIRLDPNASQRKLQADCRDRLAHFAGKSYQEAVQVCLSGDFDVELDDAKQSRLLNRFHELVVKKISCGVQVF